MPLCKLVYMSRPAEGIDEADFESILEISSKNNANKDITGMLYFGGDIFFYRRSKGPDLALAKCTTSYWLTSDTMTLNYSFLMK